jgi:hypothetical protein
LAGRTTPSDLETLALSGDTARRTLQYLLRGVQDIPQLLFYWASGADLENEQVQTICQFALSWSSTVILLSPRPLAGLSAEQGDLAYAGYLEYQPSHFMIGGADLESPVFVQALINQLDSGWFGRYDWTGQNTLEPISRFPRHLERTGR